jgi:hypothetical protein
LGGAVLVGEGIELVDQPFRRLLTRRCFFSPSLVGGLPLLELFKPKRRSNLARHPISAAFSERSVAIPPATP